jgi:hypothetical protein
MEPSARPSGADGRKDEMTGLIAQVLFNLDQDAAAGVHPLARKS